MEVAPDSMDASSEVSVARGVAAQHRGEQPPDFMKMTTEDALEHEMELGPDSVEM
jgi:hypothetical protein